MLWELGGRMTGPSRSELNEKRQLTANQAEGGRCMVLACDGLQATAAHWRHFGHERQTRLCTNHIDTAANLNVASKMALIDTQRLSAEEGGIIPCYVHSCADMAHGISTWQHSGNGVAAHLRVALLCAYHIDAAGRFAISADGRGERPRSRMRRALSPPRRAMPW